MFVTNISFVLKMIGDGLPLSITNREGHLVIRIKLTLFIQDLKFIMAIIWIGHLH